MKKKLLLLSNWSFALAFGIFIFSYVLFHYTTPECTFIGIYQTVANKPFITLLFAIWGVFFLFSGVISFLIAYIFFNEKK